MFFNKVQELLFLQKTLHEETSYDAVQCIKGVLAALNLCATAIILSTEKTQHFY